MKEPVSLSLLLVVSGLFAAGLLVVWVLERTTRRSRPEVWSAAGTQVLVLTCIFGPAYLGAGATALMMVGIGLAAAREMAQAIFRGGGSLRITAVVVGVFPGLGAVCACLLAFDRVHHVLFVYCVTELADVAAFIFGKYMGRRPLAPRLSPKKTWEGTGAGLLAGTISPFLLGSIAPDLGILALALTGLGLSLAGIAGDLVASYVKRRAQLKDFSSAVPPFGGVMDVIDAFFFAVPIYYAFIVLG